MTRSTYTAASAARDSASVKEKGAPANDQSALQTHDDYLGSQEQEQARLWREATLYMEAWLERLRLGMCRPGDLATLLGFLNSGVMFVAGCRFIERLLEAQS